MSADRPRIECAFHDDARLRAGVRAIVTHSAEQAGLSQQTQEDLAAAALEVCREAFVQAEHNGHDAALHLIVDGAADRIEITVEYPETGTKSSTSAARDIPCLAQRGAERFAGVDRVRCENSEGRSRVTLIKQCDALHSKSAD